MQHYLPKQEVGMVPLKTSQRSSAKGKTFANEREILYQVLFDMKRDLNDLKQVVRDIVEKSVDVETAAAADALLQGVATEEDLHRLPIKYSEEFLKAPFDSARRNVADSDDVQDATEYNDDVQEASEVDYDGDYDGDYADEYVEEKILSLQEIERQAILTALERHDGVRRFAARDLEISERTLYRKIKEYNLEDL